MHCLAVRSFHVSRNSEWIRQLVHSANECHMIKSRNKQQNESQQFQLTTLILLILSSLSWEMLGLFLEKSEYRGYRKGTLFCQVC